MERVAYTEHTEKNQTELERMREKKWHTPKKGQMKMEGTDKRQM